MPTALPRVKLIIALANSILRFIRISHSHIRTLFLRKDWSDEVRKDRFASFYAIGENLMIQLIQGHNFYFGRQLFYICQHGISIAIHCYKDTIRYL